MTTAGNKVVLSWSGEISGKVATSLARFLKLTLQASEPWVSLQNIAVGSFWHEELWKALRTARLGIVCLTPDNVNSKWMHFEAGVIAKTFGKGGTCPYLLNLHPAQVTGPLQHLQCTTADELGTFRLVQEINKTLRVGKLEPEMLADAFHAHWPVLRDTLGKLADEDERQRQVQERIKVVTLPTDDEMDVPFMGRADNGSIEAKKLILTRWIMQEFVLGMLEPDANREPSPLFQLHLHSDEMLRALLQGARELENIVGDEITARSRLLIPDFDDNDDAE